MINQQYNKLFSYNIRKIYIDINIYSRDNVLIDVLDGYTTSGSINLTSENPYRRSGAIEMVVSNDVEINKNTLYWLNSYIQVKIGLLDFTTNEIHWFNLGQFATKNISLKKDTSGSKIANLEILDKMAFLDGTLSGKTERQIVFESTSNIPIHEAVKSVVKLFNTPFSVEPVEVDGIVQNIPYKLEFEHGATAYTVLKTLSDLYMGYEFFFDENGIFVFRKIKNRKNDSAVWDFTNSPLLISTSPSLEISKIKNSIYVYGYKDNYGVQIKFNLKNKFERNDVISLDFIKNKDVGDVCYVKYENKSYLFNGSTWELLSFNVNPIFNIENIGEKIEVVDNANIFNEKQARIAAIYNLEINSNLGEGINFSTVPVYHLDVNNKILTNELGECLVKNINIPLKINEPMNVSAIKIY